MLTGFEVLERDEDGYSQVNALYAIIRAMRSLPGARASCSSPRAWRSRRPYTACSWASSTPPIAPTSASTRWTRPACAPRATQAKIRDEVNKARGARTCPLAATTPERADDRGLEKNEDVLRQDPHTGLGELAQGTGGFLFDNSNNLRRGSNGSRATCETTTSLATRRPTPASTASSGDRRQGEAVRRARSPRARATLPSGHRRRASQSPARRPRSRRSTAAGAERVPDSRRRAHLPELGTPGDGAGGRGPEDLADVVPDRRG